MIRKVLPVPGVFSTSRPPIVLAQDVARDRQSQAGAATIGFGGKERFGDQRQMFGRDAAGAIHRHETAARNGRRRRPKTLGIDPAGGRQGVGMRGHLGVTTIRCTMSSPIGMSPTILKGWHALHRQGAGRGPALARPRPRAGVSIALSGI